MDLHSDRDHREHVDLLVIGWGKGGKTLAGAEGRAGKRVALIEQDEQMVGGTCINVACVPTKALVHDAGARRGADDPAAWFAQAVQRRDTLTAAMRDKNHSMLDTVDTVLLVSGRAVFTGPKEVTVAQGGDTLVLTADTVVINTGSVPTIPAIDGLEGVRLGGTVHDSTTLQHADPLPRRLVVVGGGYVGLEFASMFAHFGSRVTVLDRGARPLKHEDEDVARTAVHIMEGDGVQFTTGASVTRIDPGAPDTAEAAVTYEVDGTEHTVTADAVLLALGRTAATAGLGLDEAGVVMDEHGFISTDALLRTSAEGIFAIGDVKGGQMFTYTSLDDHRIVADQLNQPGRGETRSLEDRVAVPYTMFLTPPLARVGMTVAQARTWAQENGRTLKTASKQVADIAAMPRPTIEGDPRGLISVVVDAESDLLLGASLQHVHAEEVINLVAMAMRHSVTAAELRDSIYTHPSATEALNEVLGGLAPLDQPTPST